MFITRLPRVARFAWWAVYASVAALLIWLLVRNWFLSAGEISDSFSRSEQQSWGSTDTGIPYILDGTPASFDIQNGAGVIQVPAPNLTRAAYLAAVQLRDVDVRFRFKVDKPAQGGGQLVYLIARRVKEDTFYLCRVRVLSDGSLRLQAASQVKGKIVLLGGELKAPEARATPNSYIWLRGRVAGNNPTTIQLKAWNAAAVEPTNWQYSATDSSLPLQVPGEIGLGAYLSKNTENSPVAFTFDDLRIQSYDFQMVFEYGR